jgi:hypothetical protein
MDYTSHIVLPAPPIWPPPPLLLQPPSLPPLRPRLPATNGWGGGASSSPHRTTTHRWSPLKNLLSPIVGPPPPQAAPNPNLVNPPPDAHRRLAPSPSPPLSCPPSPSPNPTPQQGVVRVWLGCVIALALPHEFKLRKVYGVSGRSETEACDPCPSSDRVPESRICGFRLVVGRQRGGGRRSRKVATEPGACGRWRRISTGGDDDVHGSN